MSYSSSLYSRGVTERCSLHDVPKWLQTREYGLQYTKKSESPEPDNNTVGKTKAVCELGIEVITNLLKDINNSEYISDDLLKSMLIDQRHMWQEL